MLMTSPSNRWKIETVLTSVVWGRYVIVHASLALSVCVNRMLKLKIRPNLSFYPKR